MGRADTHLAACAIGVALLLAVAHCAVAAADTPDSAGSQSTNTSSSDADQAPSDHTPDVKSSDDSVKSGLASEGVQTNSVAATESEPKQDTDDAEQKKPVDKESCAENHHGKTISTPVPEAPAPAEIAPVPETVAPALEAPPPLDLPPDVPSSPVEPDTVDAAAAEAGAHHSHGHELPILKVPFVVLGASVAPRGLSSGQVVTLSPPMNGEPSPALLRASSSEPLPETLPASGGLAARGQTPNGYTYAFPSRSLAGMVSVAMPGVTGIVLMTVSGICLGYRQAKAQLALIESADRFLN
ncbi:hypothetical protein [Mycobacterium sp. MMS18-G62]